MILIFNKVNALIRFYKPIFLLPLLFIIFATSANTPDKKHDNSLQLLPLEELRTFSEVYYYVKSTYVDEVDDKRLITAAIKGMVESLDSHSRFLDPSALARLDRDNNGQYAGIGLSFTDNHQGLKIDKVVPHSPAARQQITPGMIVTQINGIGIQRLSREDAYKLLKGKVNSEIKLTIINPKLGQKNGQKTSNTQSKAPSYAQDYRLTREIIELPSIHSNLLPGNVGYLVISQFTKKSLVEFTQAINTLSQQQPISQLIIDLRNNPGGVLEAAVQISDLFIKSGKILTASGRAKNSNEIFNATSAAPYHDLDVVIMINAHSASSSEIFAAAMQDHKRATIVGDISYGKGSIQSIYFLPYNAGLKITTAKYYSPNGHEIQNVGIKPDVLFKTAGLENQQADKKLDDLELLQAFKLISQKNISKNNVE